MMKEKVKIMLLYMRLLESTPLIGGISFSKSITHYMIWRQMDLSASVHAGVNITHSMHLLFGKEKKKKKKEKEIPLTAPGDKRHVAPVAQPLIKHGRCAPPPCRRGGSDARSPPRRALSVASPPLDCPPTASSKQ